jgi:hypothetical protein
MLWQPEYAMTVHDRYTTRTAQALVGAQKKARFGLEAPGLTNLSQRLVVFNATVRDVENLMPRARQSMGGGASNEVVHRVARHNPDSFWGMARRERYAAGETLAEGFVAFLMLNEEGVDRLLGGEFDATDPPLHLLTRQNEKPAAIYFWGVYAPGLISGGVPLAFDARGLAARRKPRLSSRRKIQGEGRTELPHVSARRLGQGDPRDL